MSLRDRLRRPGATDRTSHDVAPGRTYAEITDFTPRQDGDYHCVELGCFLRFARPAVTETMPSTAGVARGEFTTAGRFTVQRPLSRPVVYTVLAFDAVSITARRTDTATGTSAEYEFVFEPDE